MTDDFDKDTLTLTISDADIKPAWHRREDEPPRAYEYFDYFLHMGKDRNLLDLAVELGLKERTVYGYNLRYQWAARARLYDATQSAIIESADDMLKTRIRQRIYDETTIIRDAFMETVLATLEGGMVTEVTPYAYEILRERGVEPTGITISAKIDLSFFKDVAQILAALNRELKGSKDMPMMTAKIERDESPFDRMVANLLKDRA